ncbi:MAG: hypothetical protein ACOX0A_02610 [Thermoguttaceae bacterium]|jgi:hypothetical protein
MKQTRRDFLKYGALATCSLCGVSRHIGGTNLLGEEIKPQFPLYEDGQFHRIDSQERTYHVSCSIDMFEINGDFPEIWRDVGITDAWLSVWFYGHFPYSWETLDYWLGRLKSAEIRPHLLCVPFCHGGGALDPRTEGFPNLPPEHWKIAKRWNGAENWGFSWHSPTDVEGAEAIKKLYAHYGAFNYFLDDDFRFSSNPNDVGGCVCEECQRDFLNKSGLEASRWDDVLDDIRMNSDTPLLRAWVDYFCDRLTQCFQRWQNTVPEIDLGIMVMYMGCERAGIRLEDYKNALFRVGEGGFSDAWYNSDKTKTVELFSSLFHRRFCSPGRAFSETTVFPEKSLSAENLASKLAISTISDVRNTCFMSGLTPIDVDHWPVLHKRMVREKEMHAKLLGVRPNGPFKHYYGESARYCAGENAYSLFLALGVPFEVCDAIPDNGWTFLSDADALSVDRGSLSSQGSRLIARFDSAAGRFTKVPEDYESLFAFRRSILMKLQEDQVPYVEEEIPLVLAWYPDLNSIYIWNISREEKTFHVRLGDKLFALKLEALASQLVDLGAIG